MAQPQAPDDATGTAGRIDLTHKQRLPLPPVLAAEFAFRRRLMAAHKPMAPAMDKPPNVPFKHAYGFVFAWGVLWERRQGNQVVWEFCPEALLGRCHRQGLLLEYLQHRVFAGLEQALPAMVAYGWDSGASLTQGWQFYAGTSVSACCLQCHFLFEAAARAWLADVFLPQYWLALLYQVQCGLDAVPR
ncbi:MAG: hypothetical protein WC757_00130 [Candidatus Paceibacterota bacterium]|jgi:hypothetical protein